MKTVVVETKNEQDIAKAIEVLSLTIKEDPTKLFYFTDPEERRRHTHYIVGKMFKVNESAYRVFVCKEGSTIVGAAMWFPPGYEMSYLSLVKNGLLKAPFIFGFSQFMRIMKSLSFSDKNKMKTTGGKKHWQLFYLGVHPEHQNKGYGTLLLAPILEESDKGGIPVFLENFTDDNTRFYERNGFEVKSTFPFNEDILMRNMVRQPGAAGKKIPHSGSKKKTGKK